MFSHIADMHLGLAQYGSNEREDDIYEAFNQSINISIKDHVDFVIFAGDIFHMPNASGNAIMNMANALKRLKENNIDSFFILGEHDISRIRSTPIPYVYHNLGFSKYIGDGKICHYKDNILITGYDKIRKNEIQNYDKKFKQLEETVSNHNGHKIIVMHQGITEINKFAGELNSNELPNNFTYYAMGHLHEHCIKKFNNLNGPLVYPGSIEITTSESIKETEKGFYEVDISTQDAIINWIKLDTRPQYSIKATYNELNEIIIELIKKSKEEEKKPIIELILNSDENLETDLIQTHISKLSIYTLFCFWKIIKEDKNKIIFTDRPTKVDDELLKLAKNSLDSELAYFAIKELLPLLNLNKIDEAEKTITENFEKFRNDKINRIK